MLKSLFNKAAGHEDCNFIKKILQHICFPVNITKFLSSYFEEYLPTNASEGKSDTKISIKLYNLAKPKYFGV